MKDKIWTQKDVDKVKANKYGVRVFPAHTRFAEWCRFDERCSFGEWCSFGEVCSFGEGCRFGERCKAQSPFWSFVYEPPFKTEGMIRPTEASREYWETRLKMKLPGCYSDIKKLIQPKLVRILKRKDLTKCERRVLESWKG